MHAKLLSGGQDDATHNRLGTAGLEGTGGTGRPGCGAGGQRRSQDDTQTTSAARLDAAAEPGQASRHGPGRGAGGRRRGLAELVQATQAPPVWRAPEGPEGRAAVPVGGGGAWPDNESTRRAKLAARTAGGPPHTSTPSSPAPQPGPPPPGTPAAPSTPPEHQRRNTPPRHSKAARPRRGRAAQPVSEDHRRTTTMSGLPRPLSWRTFEMPSFDAMSLAVPSMRGSS